MGLEALQRELAARATGRPAAGENPGLPPADQLESFAAALVRKRAREVRELLPRTARLLGERFDGLFGEYAEGRPTEGPQRHRRDAVAFAASLRERGQAAGETARYEASWLEMGLGRRVLLRKFPAGAIEDGADGYVVVLWWRGLRGRVRALHWPPKRPASRSL
ncbi:MAG: hypothetical protein GC160_13370 [Acidobacteria bacterium]|nr:hypothetical protein [Acidobacteriota bacterium]